MKFLKAGLACALLLGAGAAMAQQPPSAPSASLAVPADAPPPKSTPPGPHKVAIEADPGLMTHTVYRPADLSAFTGDDRLPIVAWGNGACSNAGLLFANFLTQVASHGYLVIASGPKDAVLPAFASQRAGQAAQSAGTIPAGRTNDEDLIKAIDWAIAENARQGSPYFGRLDPTKVAVMGQSCGGLQATAVAADPRIKTVVIWNSGVFNDPTRMSPNGQPARSLSGATKESLKAFHAPVAYFLGGPGDVAYANGKDDFERVTVPAFFGSINSGHGGTFNHPGAGWFGEVGVKWLDWRLKGDAAAARWFVGEDCVLCREPIWEVKRKGL
ncbi:alpha/beta hydrolase family protein [Phenylobacterium terrae]|uniref:Alpha/beta hydrolase family protein n=1 Tax=Phenylobacterium terrae TaxID=2665495 RepID=A0ABW4MVX1_9CAUL